MKRGPLVSAQVSKETYYQCKRHLFLRQTWSSRGTALWLTKAIVHEPHGTMLSIAGFTARFESICSMLPPEMAK